METKVYSRQNFFSWSRVTIPTSKCSFFCSYMLNFILLLNKVSEKWGKTKTKNYRNNQEFKEKVSSRGRLPP